MTIGSGAETQVNTYTMNDQMYPQTTALADGGWVVTWASYEQDGSNFGVYQHAFDADGTKRGVETRVSTHTASEQSNPQVAALSGGGWVVTWRSYEQDGSGYGVYQQAFDADGTKLGDEKQVNTHATSDQNSPQITALSGGGWVVTWISDGQDGWGAGVYQQAYDADGMTSGGESRVNTVTDDYQYVQKLTALSDGGWVATWWSWGQDGSNWGVYQQAFNADGTKRGVETQVNTHTGHDQAYQEIAALPDGGWVTIWASDDQDGSGMGIYQQVFNVDGTRRGDPVETLVNTHTTHDQQGPQIAVLADGGWVVTWHSYGQDGSGWGIHQQAFDADGTKRGVETQVNTYATNEQSAPQITALSDGGWVVTWHSWEQDGSETGVYQQAFEADGTKHGDETQVNTYTTGSQYIPQVTAVADGGWVVTWISAGQDGSGYGIYQRTFWRNDAPTLNNDIDAQTAHKLQPLNFTFDANTFTDPDQLDSLTYQATLDNGDPLPSWLSFDETTRTFTGTPTLANTGVITVRVTATDISGETVSTTFVLNVENRAPILPVNTTVSTFENAKTAIDVLSGAQDLDGDTLTVTAASVLSGFGSVSIDGSGRLLYDPTTAANQNIAAGETRSVVLRYTVSDGDGGTKTANVTVTVKGISPDIFKGTSGHDTLNGSLHGDLLYGYEGRDTLDGKAGADQMRGGDGDDTYLVDNTGDVIVELTGEGTDLVKASVSYTLSSNVENLTLTGSSTLSGTGNTLANVLVGNDGNNVLDGKSGADRMIGGKGNDTYVIDNVADAVVESASAGTDLVKASASYTLASNVENLTLTGAGKINATGNTLANTLTGNDANNILDGKTGADRMIGGKGNDIYRIDNLGDVVVEGTGAGTDLVQSSISYTLGGNVENLTLIGTARLTASGNSLANVLTGNDANNILDGKTGADRMIGGKGNDTYIVDNAGDAITEGACAGTDLVQSSVSYTLASNIEKLTLTGSAKIGGFGNSLSNTIIGNNANNILEGKGGTDTLVGGGGDDRLIGGGDGTRDNLYGGTGADIFVFLPAQGKKVISAEDRDTIFDFSQSQGDKMDLKGMDADTKTSADDAFRFLGTDRFHKTAGELRYEIRNGEAYVSGDTDGDGFANFSIKIALNLALKGTDFIL
ncbi:putative Ig domain-containing protein [Shinella curvata]|uniref:Ig domain-containing protein n=1 Tax=Shinella curvata TaxID=1817964 RepID=A0ABT8XIR0_9HYPH|nr:putative Ig domain-containing protein [Shinella curvata]MCJ8052547.1 putative Ig domain-containing protein [Shinella curvata]MDO6123627.1 putative Ig domain-containing protein [Shinella curvata]